MTTYTAMTTTAMATTTTTTTTTTTVDIALTLDETALLVLATSGTSMT